MTCWGITSAYPSSIKHKLVSSPSVSERERSSVLNRKLGPLSPAETLALAKQIENREKTVPRLICRLS